MAKLGTSLLNVTILDKGQAHRAVGVIELLELNEESKHAESVDAIRAITAQKNTRGNGAQRGSQAKLGHCVQRVAYPLAAQAG
jgi:hypothetical protein